MTDYQKLRTIADWFDVNHPSQDNEVQKDLRRIADLLEQKTFNCKPLCMLNKYIMRHKIATISVTLGLGKTNHKITTTP